MNFKTHKDKSPRDTINEIRKILSESGIFTTEKKWYSVTNNCHSVNLVCSDLQCSTNGKGISEEYALASAYAEFMERLQSNYLFATEFGLMGNGGFNYPDDIEMTLGSYAEENKSIIEYTMDPIIIEKYKHIKINCFPSYDLMRKEVKYLPYFLTSTFRSNGVCAGNTPEEALCQGICEIFERSVIREVYNNKNLDLPTIPLEVLKNLEIYEIIDDIVKKGYKVIIKDCTSNGKLPVVGVILFNKDNTSYIYRYGSDPIFEVALQRCLTELFQGKDESSLNKKFNNKLEFSAEQYKNMEYSSEEDNIKLQYEKTVISTNGELPNHIFISANETRDYKKGFQDEFTSHGDSLGFLTGIIRRNNYAMYIQNMSTQGFPTYRIFIPELSVIHRLNYETFKVYFIDKKFIRSVLLNIKKTEKDNIQKCAEFLEPLVSIPEQYFVCRGILNPLLHIIIDDSSHLKQFDNLFYLLGMLFFCSGNYKKTFQYMNIYIKEHGKELGNLDYYSCVLMYLKLQSEKYSENEISKILTNTFGENLSNEVISDLANPEDCFRYFTLPECGDCSTCPIKKECRYDKWKEVNEKIVQKIKSNPINQEDVSGIFNIV